MSEPLKASEINLDKERQLSSSRRKNKIRDYTEINGLQRKVVRINDSVVYILSNVTQEIPEEKLAKYVASLQATEPEDMKNYCYRVSAKAVENGSATGRIAAGSGTQEFASWGSHCINYDELADGSIVAYDLTAGVNIDNNQGNFDVLIVHDSTLDDVLSKIGELYGGKWAVV